MAGNERTKKIENYIRKLNPSKLGLDKIGEISIKEMARGGYNINYLVEIDEHKFVFRLNLDKYLDVVNQTEYEFEILKYLEGKEIAPKAYFIDTSKTNLEYDLLVEEFIENKPVQFGEQFLKNFGHLVRKLHLLPPSKNNLVIRNLDSLVNQWNFIKNKIDFIKRSGFNKEFLDFITDYIPRIERYVSECSKLFPVQDICINHRDLVIENVLQTKKGLRLIDWQSVIIDDPSYDLAFFLCDIVIEWNLNRTLTDKEKQIFLNSYGVNKALWEKIKIRQPMIYLELFVWVAYRASYLRRKLVRNLVKEEDKGFIQKRIKAYENFLGEERMKKYLNF